MISKRTIQSITTKLKHPLWAIDKLNYCRKKESLVPFCEKVTDVPVPLSVLIESFKVAISDDYRRSTYIIVRMLKPDSVIETGVAKGGTTQAMLLAMKKNQKGHLYSIDLPGGSQAYKKIITKDIKDKWTLILGDSCKELPKLMNKIGKVDIFLFDSHAYDIMDTYNRMLFEINQVAGKAKIILLDDPYWTVAFKKMLNKEVFVLDRGKIRGIVICIKEMIKNE